MGNEREKKALTDSDVGRHNLSSYSLRRAVPRRCPDFTDLLSFVPPPCLLAFISASSPCHVILSDRRAGPGRAGPRRRVDDYVDSDERGTLERVGERRRGETRKN